MKNKPIRTSPRFTASNLTEASDPENPRTSPTKRNKMIDTSSPELNCTLNSCNSLSQNELKTSEDPINMLFYLQRLEVLYQNLEGRVQKLELLFSNQFSGGSLTNNTGFNVETSGGSTRGLFELNHSIMNPSNCSTSSTSTIASLIDPIPKEISKSDLDDYCLPLLQRRAVPSIGELNSIVMNMKKLRYPDLDNKFILSKVREWFRRKREYMSQRIFNICAKKYAHLMNDPVAIKELMKKSRDCPEFVAEIGREANLEILNVASAWEFCSEKISGFFENIVNHPVEL